MPYQNTPGNYSVLRSTGGQTIWLEIHISLGTISLETFCCPERLPDPRTEELPGVYLDMTWYLLTTDDIPFLQIKLISL